MDVRLLNKYIAGDVLPEEKKEVIRWMRESEEHREQLMQLHRIYNATLWNGNVDSQDTKNAEKKKPVMRYLWASMKIAAVVAMLAFIIHKEYQDYRLEHSGRTACQSDISRRDNCLAQLQLHIEIPRQRLPL